LVDVEGKASTQMLTEGNWRDGEVEKALKSILSFAKLFGGKYILFMVRQ